MTNTLFGKDILATNDLTKDELDQLLGLAFRFKKKGIASRSLEILKGKTLLLLFFYPSTRTRISFTTAMQQLGGFVQCPDPGDLRLSLEEKPGAGESIKDTARVVERYVDVLGIRHLAPMPDENGIPRLGGGEAVTRKFADCTDMPVISLASDMHHPTQAIADLMVTQESLGEVRRKKVVMMWAYSPLLRVQVSPISTGLIAGTYGMDVTFVYPEGYDLHPPLMSQVKEECKKGGGKFEISHDLKRALEGADIVYPRNWVTSLYYIHTKEEELRLASHHKDWRLTESLLKLTNNARFIHCMPFDRGNEVDDSVVDGPNSVVYDEAENLLHVRKACLVSTLVADSRVLKSI
jgi:N-acetylornithine carbamoyltransferase